MIGRKKKLKNLKNYTTMEEQNSLPYMVEEELEKLT